MQYRQELAEHALDSLPAAATDAQIVEAHADYLLSRGPAPYVLRLNHDARKAPCPVWRDWKRDDLSGATFKDKTKAHAWIVEAMTLGYDVSRAQGNLHTAHGRGTLTGIRSRLISRETWAAKRAEAKRNGLPDPDDDIPF